MKKRLLISAAASLGCALAGAQTVSPPEELFLSVEPGGTALVRELRSAQLVEGRNSLQAFECSPRILPASIHLRSLTHPADLRLREQSLWFEVLDEARLLELLVGQEVDLLVQRALESERVQGRLLLPPRAPTPTGERRVPLFLETTEGDIRVVEGGELTLDVLPDGAWNRVRLDWALEARTAGRHRIELCYRTEGLDLAVAYSLRLDAKGEQADLLGVARLDNQTGHRFANARLKLALPGVRPRAHWPGGAEARAVYPIPEPVTLEPRRTKEVRLVHTVGVAVRSGFSLFPAAHPAGQANSRGRTPVVRRHELSATGEGFPAQLPPGPVRVIRQDEDLGTFTVGESWLPASVSGETLSFAGLPLAGLEVERRSETTRDERGPVQRFELNFHNERSEAVAVQVLQPLGVREVVRSDAARVDLGRPGWALIHVDVPSQSTFAVQYRVVVE